MDKILQEDLENIKNAEFIPWDEMEGKIFLISGATGLIGYTLVRAIILNATNSRVIIVTRDKEKAKNRFKDIDDKRIGYVEKCIEDIDDIDGKIDYIIHGAANTSSKAFISSPVECANTIIRGTMNMLELARKKTVSSFVFLSSMEVYGYPPKGHKVEERDSSIINATDIRSVYPVAKMTAESLCVSYCSEYDVPAKIVRLTQTFGPGVDYNDGRVFAEFARCAIEKKDIVLKTAGETERSYLYTADAATAILLILARGKNSEAYNVANENSFCSIKQMAELAAMYADINVKYDIQKSQFSGYAHELHMDLDTSKLKKLGWNISKDTLTMEQMMARMFDWILDYRHNC